MDFIPWIITGLLTSVHCISMCGTMVTSIAIKDDGKRRINFLPHLIYNGARLFSYTAVGALLGLLGSAIDFGPIKGGVSIFAGFFMIVMGINMLNIFPWLRVFQIRMPKSIGKLVFKHRPQAHGDAGQGGPSLGAPLTFGLLTGFMPCGPLQAMQLLAAGSGSALKGAAAMFTFGMGTTPLLLGFGSFTSVLGHTFKKKMMKVAAVVIMMLGLIMLNRGLVLQGIPYNLNTGWVALKAQVGIVDDSSAGEAKVAKGKKVQEITMVIENVRFVPSSINLKQGIPVRMTIDRREDNVCSSELVIPQLGVRKVLAPFGKTVVEFTPDKEGALNMTCQMGMMQATAFVGRGAGGPQTARAGANPFFTFLVGAALAWVIITLKNTPGFINLPKPKPIPAPAAASAGRRAAYGGRRKNTIQFEISHEMLMVAAIIAFAIFAGWYLGSPNQGGTSNGSVSTPVQQAPAPQGSNGGIQAKQPAVSGITNASLNKSHYDDREVESPSRQEETVEGIV